MVSNLHVVSGIGLLRFFAAAAFVFAACHTRFSAAAGGISLRLWTAAALSARSAAVFRTAVFGSPAAFLRRNTVFVKLFSRDLKICFLNDRRIRYKRVFPYPLCRVPYNLKRFFVVSARAPAVLIGTRRKNGAYRLVILIIPKAEKPKHDRQTAHTHIFLADSVLILRKRKGAACQFDLMLMYIYERAPDNTALISRLCKLIQSLFRVF